MTLRFVLLAGQAVPALSWGILRNAQPVPPFARAETLTVAIAVTVSVPRLITISRPITLVKASPVP